MRWVDPGSRHPEILGLRNVEASLVALRFSGWLAVLARRFEPSAKPIMSDGLPASRASPAAIRGDELVLRKPSEPLKLRLGIFGAVVLSSFAAGGALLNSSPVVLSKRDPDSELNFFDCLGGCVELAAVELVNLAKAGNITSVPVRTQVAHKVLPIDLSFGEGLKVLSVVFVDALNLPDAEGALPDVERAAQAAPKVHVIAVFLGAVLASAEAVDNVLAVAADNNFAGGALGNAKDGIELRAGHRLNLADQRLTPASKERGRFTKLSLEEGDRPSASPELGAGSVSSAAAVGVDPGFPELALIEVNLLIEVPAVEVELVEVDVVVVERRRRHM